MPPSASTSSFEEVFKLRMKAVRNRARLDPMLEALGGIAVAGVIALAYWRIASGISTVGDFMGFVTALLMAAQPIRGARQPVRQGQEGLAAAERIYEVLDEQPTSSTSPAPGRWPSAGAIRFEDVSFAYDAQRRGARPCATSRSTCRAARRWRWSAARAPASRR